MAYSLRPDWWLSKQSQPTKWCSRLKEVVRGSEMTMGRRASPSALVVREVVAYVKEYATKARALKKGDLILKRTLKDGATNKITHIWEGPYKIVEVGKEAFWLDHLDGYLIHGIQQAYEYIIVKIPHFKKYAKCILRVVEIQGDSKPKN
ncbi:hypothetical protein CR513_31290, partial [Mucuna pruriens]